MDNNAFAALLHGASYPFQLPAHMLQLAKSHGFVVLYGASDDLYELEGALCHEGYTWDGECFLLFQEGARRVDASRPPPSSNTPGAVFAHWGRDGADWRYTTEIPHATFHIMEGKRLYCVGLVFNLLQLPQSTD